MKKLSFYLIAFLIVPAIIFTGCNEDETVDPIDPVQVLKDYLISTDMDLNHVIKNADDAKFVTGAPAADDLAAFLSEHYIIDIRSATDYAAGYIEGAINVPFADILTEAANADKKMLIVCYTGQTACYATSLLRLYGYHDAQALKWGMSGWNDATAGSWNGNVGNIADGHANWTYDAAPTNQTYEAAEFTSALEDGEAILKERVEAVVADGFKGKTPLDVLDAPGSFFINNYFSETHYAAFGHIDGAVRINPLLIGDDSALGLDPLKDVITYCYTGQTSAVITAFLCVLGYEAYSLKFGMNGLWNENAGWGTPEDDVTNQWGFDSNPKDLPIVQ